MPDKVKNEISIRKPDPGDFMVSHSSGYMDVQKLHPVFDKLWQRRNIILHGPKGVGKSISILDWALAQGTIPLITQDCSEDTRRTDLIGMFAPVGDEIVYAPGSITTAIMVANEIGHAILVMEEMNALVPQMQKILNPLTDTRRSIFVPELGKVISLDPEATLWVVGVMNPAVHGGVYALNEDLKSRFDIILVDYPSSEDEAKILKKRLPNVNKDILKRSLTFARETRAAMANYSLSTRDLEAFLDDVAIIGPMRAMYILLGKFDDDTRATIAARAKSAFGSTMDVTQIANLGEIKKLT